MLDAEKTREASPLDGVSAETENSKDESESRRGPLVTRRNFLAACLAGGAALIMWPRLSWGVGGGAWGGWGLPLTRTSRNFGYDCEWTDANFGVAAGWVRVSSSTNAECTYSNELYDLLHVKLYMAGAPQGYWTYGWGTGSTGYIGATGYAEYSEDINMYTNYGHGTGYNEYLSRDFWYKRKKQQRDIHCWANSSTWGIGTPAWDGNYLWSCVPSDDVPYQTQYGIGIRNTWRHFGKISCLVPYNKRDSRVCGNDGLRSSGEGLCLWTTEEARRNQNGDFAVVCWNVDDSNDGHLHRLVSIPAPGLELNYRGASGPTTDASRESILYTPQSAADVWVDEHAQQLYGGADDDVSVIYYDGNGLCLDHKGGTADVYDGIRIQIHSSGYAGLDYSDVDTHWFVFDECVFSGELDLPAPERGDESISCPDPAETCNHWDEYGTGATRYEYRWYATEGEPELDPEPEARVMCAFQREWGIVGAGGDGRDGVDCGVPAHQYCGLPCEGIPLIDVNFWVEGTKHPGEIHYRAYTDAGKASALEASGGCGARPNENLIHSGFEMRSGEGTWHGHSFRKSGYGACEEARVDGCPAEGAERGFRIAATAETLSNSEDWHQIGLCQDTRRLSAGEQVTQGVWMKGSRAGIPCCIQPFWLPGGSDHSDVERFETTGEWQFVSCTSTTAASGNFSLGYVYIDEGAKAGDSLLVACDKVERGSEATQRRFGNWLGGSPSQSLYWIEMWLSGEAAEYFDLQYRAFNTGNGDSGWGDWVRSTGEDDHPAAGHASQMRSLQCRLIPKPKGAKVASEFSADPELAFSEDIRGLSACCAVELAAPRADITGDGVAALDGKSVGLANRYLGTVISGPATIPALGFNVRYFVDGEPEPCFEELWKDVGRPYLANATAKTAAQKPNCLEVACWFTDATCTKAYSTKVLEADLDLYAYNRCSLEYGTTGRSCVLDDSYAWKADEALTRPLVLSELYPVRSVVKYGTDVKFAGPWKAYCLDMGQTRTATSGGACTPRLRPRERRFRTRLSRATRRCTSTGRGPATTGSPRPGSESAAFRGPRSVRRAA